MENNKTFSAYLYILGAVALWGGNWVAVRYAVQEMTPLVVVTIRSILAAIILMSVFVLMKGKRPPKKELWRFAWLGLFGLFGFNILQYTGLEFTTAFNGSLINAATPIMVALFSRFIIQERLNFLQIIGIILSFFGVVWIITNGSWITLLSLNFNIGDILLLLAATCWALYTIYSRKPTLQYSALTVTALASVFSAFYFIPFGVTQYNAAPVSDFSFGLILAIGYCVLVAVLGLVAWVKGVSIVGPSKASVFMNLMPLFTLSFGYVLLGETVTLHQLLGGVFVIAGVYLVTQAHNLVRLKPSHNSKNVIQD